MSFWIDWFCVVEGHKYLLKLPGDLTMQPGLRTTDLDHWSEMFSVKGHIGNILAFLGYTVSITTTQLCHSSKKGAIDDT